MISHPRYELLEKIASGSFATVYRGRDIELGRDVAIKQIHDQFLQDPLQLERYWQEAQLLASFQHPNIVTIYDVVRDRGWLILELMQSDLSRVAGRKQMDLGALRTTLAHCLRALKFLHSHGIVHGDIKPSNMMIDRRRRVKIGDFGLARRVSDEGGSLIKGTTKYMAPEVVSDEFGDVGPASDLYSLGFAAYELMCGENFESLFPGLSAFGRDRQMAWMMWHAAPDRRLPEITRVLADVPEDLAKTIQKLVAKPQTERYRSADEALSDLKIDVRLVKSGEDTVEGLGKTTVSRTIDPNRKRRWMAIGAFVASAVVSLAALFSGGGDSGSTPVGKAASKSGIVRQVLADENKVVIEDDEGALEVSIGKQPRIRLNGEDWILLRDLEKNDRIEFQSPPEADKPLIAVTRPVTGHGQLKEVDPTGSLLTVAIAADPHPMDVRMFVPKGGKLTLNGDPVELAELRPGDATVVTHVKDKDNESRAARRVIRLDAKRAITLTGFVHDVKPHDGQLMLALHRHRANLPSIPFSPEVKIAINGRTRGESGEYGPKDLKPGDRVVVTQDTHVLTVDAERRGHQMGVLLKIEPSAGEIEVRSEGSDGQELSYRIGEECRIWINDKPAKLDELQRFDNLDVTFDESEKQPLTARTIDVYRR